MDRTYSRLVSRHRRTGKMDFGVLWAEFGEGEGRRFFDWETTVEECNRDNPAWEFWVQFVTFADGVSPVAPAAGS